MNLYDVLKALDESDVTDIKVKHSGILEVPEGKSVESMSMKHFKELIDRKGWAAISKALVNLVRWNKKKNPGLASWADSMQSKLSKWVDSKKE